MKNKDVTGIDVSQEIGRLKEELAQKNRELQIETALERVRSRAIKMDKSDELIEVVHFLNEEIKRLGIIIDNSSIITDFGSFKKGLINWIAAKNHNYMEKFHIPYIKHQITTNFENAIKKNISYYSDSYSKPEKDEYFKLLFKYSDFKTIPKERQQFIFSTPGWSRATVLSKNSVLIFQRYYNSVFTIQEEQIFKQFGKVFEQAYTRFLDLQKAEAHAREAEIQLALERVRAGAMAMHKSEELSDTASILFQELNKLGLNILRTGVCIFDFDNDCAELWLATEDGDKTETKVLGKVYGYMHPMYRKWIDAGAQKKKYFQHKISDNEVPQYYDLATSVLSLPKQTTYNKSEIYNGFFFPGGSINIISLTPLSEEECEIGHRFANVFGLLYTRFLDLQKAETQAREAEIELGLERIRARSLAMHNSNELWDVINVVFTEFEKLNIQIDSCWINIYKKEDDGLNTYVAAGGQTYPGQVYQPYINHPIFNIVKNGKKNPGNVVSEAFDKDIAKRYWKHLFDNGTNIQVSKKRQDDILSSEGLTSVFAFGKYSCMGVHRYNKNHFTEEDKNVVKRFCLTFDQIYTRFLDLQKAETQAKEAEIQLALERVRARSMAMHKSKELQDVVAIVFEQLQSLKFGLDGAAAFIGTRVENFKGLDFWMEDKITQPACFRLPYHDSPSINDIYYSWEKGNDFVSKIYGKEKNIWFEYAFKYTDLKIVPEDRKKWILEQAHLTQAVALEKNSMIGIHAHHIKKLTESEIDILKRCSKVFEQAYTRFLDLQKAEAQAKEAQIEVALERVRAKAMAMHTSNDLKDVARELRRQMGNLGLKELETCAIHLYEGSDEFFTSWAALQSPNSKSEIILIETQLPKKGVRNLEKIIDYYNQNKLDYVIANDWNQFQEFSQALKVHSPEALKVVQKTTRNLQKNKIQSYWSVSDFKGGSLLLSSVTKPEDAYLELLRRFTNVFDLAYRRFSDLKKAEAQAREAQIEAALERVRSRTMGMQHSDELQEAAVLLFQQVVALGVPAFATGFNIWDDERKSVTAWMGGQDRMQPPFKVSGSKDIFLRICEASEKGESLFVEDQTGEALKQHYEYMNSIPIFKQIADKMAAAGQSFPTFQIMHSAFFTHGYLMFITFEPVPEAYDIFKRFAKVFEQTYTRFLDLQKAEAQAREAQIEAALEKVRNRTLLMRDSSELNDAVAVFFEQFKLLELLPAKVRTYFSHVNTTTDTVEVWMTHADGTVMSGSHITPMTKSTQLKNFYHKWKNNKEIINVRIYKEQDLVDYINFLTKLPHVAKDEDYQKLFKTPPDQIVMTDAGFIQGFLGIMSFEPLEQEAIDLLTRFAKVFEFTYTRFLDLQKAEAQARESQIEAALERIRARSLGMHKSNELRKVVELLYKEIKPLIPDFNTVNIQLNQSPSKDLVAWLGIEGNLYPNMLHWPASKLPIFNTFFEAWKSKTGFVNIFFNPEEKDAFFDELYDYLPVPPDRKKLIKELEGVIIMGWFHKYSSVYLLRYNLIPFSEEEKKIVKRFSSVFEQAYTRFLDLKKAEAQAQEAMKQASLDRVRGEIASMRTSDDLNRITPVIWRELQALEVPFIRCGVFIIDDVNEKVQVYLTTPEGTALAALNLSIDANRLTKNTIHYWRKSQVYTEHWNKEDFINWTKSMMKIGQIQSAEKYQGASDAPESLNLHFIPFKQGMLYVGNVSPLSNEKLELVKSLADSFSIAYARYEDFVNLENAKNKIESTFNDLKAAQTQLVQSEKMASLGELTAGIAHEIQNPLNFVNNFSEVSTELLEELKEEIEKGDLEEVKIIVEDVMQNLEKILNHGRRADGIVKSMLQHSRGSGGQKAPTDINVLADEYLRLSYHGFRAKDKTFNADYKLEADENLPKINVIPQDIGRVLLNLINNAFFAVNEKAKTITPQPSEGGVKSAPIEYKPEVIVSTTSSKSPSGDLGVKISVKDNGPGIPDSIKEKIFQPFFTTKPTGSGTGLGLSLSYDIIKAHGGTITVESSENVGTEFIILIPIT